MTASTRNDAQVRQTARSGARQQIFETALGEHRGDAGQAEHDARDAAGRQSLAVEQAAQRHDQDRRGGVDQADVERRHRARADVDPGAADPHADRPQQQQVAPFARESSAMAHETRPGKRQQQHRHEEPPPQRQRVRRHERGVARHQHVDGEHRGREQQQRPGDATAGEGRHGGVLARRGVDLPVKERSLAALGMTPFA